MPVNSKLVFLRQFGHVPEYRIGVHGGPIATSEEGDTRRAIGFYGDTINIAARLEQKARELGVDCILSGSIAECQVSYLVQTESKIISYD